MRIIKSSKELCDFRKTICKKVGFVPTMGALHAGHASLIKHSISQNDVSIVSVFLNPTQFGENEDLASYPRTPKDDIALCESLGVDVIFMPEVSELYDEHDIKILAPTSLSSILEGQKRVGHFDGVCTIVAKLLNLVHPHNCYFGKKDAQQVAVIRKLVKSLFIDTNIISCEIVRDSDGLALSSRNVYLSSDERIKALRLNKSLQLAQKLIGDGEIEIDKIKKEMFEVLGDLRVDYIEILDRNFGKIDNVELNNTIILLAVFVGTTRLIDNLWV